MTALSGGIYQSHYLTSKFLFPALLCVLSWHNNTSCKCWKLPNFCCLWFVKVQFCIFQAHGLLSDIHCSSDEDLEVVYLDCDASIAWLLKCVCSTCIKRRDDHHIMAPEWIWPTEWCFHCHVFVKCARSTCFTWHHGVRVNLTYRVKSAHKLKLTDKQLLQWTLPILLIMVSLQ